MFNADDKVEIVESGTAHMRTGRILTFNAEKREMLVEVLFPSAGAKVWFRFVSFSGWKVLYSFPGQESFTDPDKPAYVIRKVS